MITAFRKGTVSHGHRDTGPCPDENTANTANTKKSTNGVNNIAGRSGMTSMLDDPNATGRGGATKAANTMRARADMNATHGEAHRNGATSGATHAVKYRAERNAAIPAEVLLLSRQNTDVLDGHCSGD